MSFSLELRIIFMYFFHFSILCLSRKYLSDHDGQFDYRTEYSGNLFEIYSQYLSHKSLNEKCSQKGQTSELTDRDFIRVFQEVDKQLEEIKDLEQKALDADPRYKAIYNELATKSLVNDECITEFDSILNLHNIPTLNKPSINSGYCDLESNVSPSLKCDFKLKYRRIDGKCNNLKSTDWGAAYYCQRRLLPLDGVSQSRVATDGSPLQNARLLSEQLFIEKPHISNLTSLNTMWGQLIAHDTFYTVFYMECGLDCCAPNHKSTHPECMQREDIPRDQ